MIDCIPAAGVVERRKGVKAVCMIVCASLQIWQYLVRRMAKLQQETCYTSSRVIPLPILCAGRSFSNQ